MVSNVESSNMAASQNVNSAAPAGKIVKIAWANVPRPLHSQPAAGSGIQVLPIIPFGTTVLV
jgi:hypothetical protein